tara:strand:- start:788 stop:1693 length:906 start_codon:yes stop_codon:yes gene_type:complete
MRVAVTGASGMLGSAILRQFSGRFELFALARSHGYIDENVTWACFDLLDTNLLETWLKENTPDIIIHCAANVNVDECEKNRDKTSALHVGVTSVLANYCSRFSKKLLYISTDSVFNGQQERAYTEIDDPDPLNYYAQTKLFGEIPVLECGFGTVLRTNILGWGSGRKTTFFDWLLNGLKSGAKLTLFKDVIFSPITVEKCSFILEKLITEEVFGLFHCGSSDGASKYEFGILTAKIFNLPHEQLECVSVESFCFDATRPKNMSLDCNKIEGALDITLPTVKTTILNLRTEYAKFNTEMLNT